MRYDYKNKLLNEIKQLKLNFSNETYEEILKKVLKCDDPEVIYLFKSNFEFAPTELLAKQIMQKNARIYVNDISKEIKKDTWRIKFAKDFGNINLYVLLACIRGIYDGRRLFEDVENFNIEDVNENLLLLSTIKGAPTKEIYDFIKEIDVPHGKLMKEFLNSEIELDLDLIINEFAHLDVYNGQHPKEIYNFVLNYQDKIDSSEMDEIILILLEKLQDYYNYILPDEYKYSYYNDKGDEALDILVSFLTDIKNLTAKQKRELIRNSLKRIQYDISINKEHSQVIRAYENMKQSEKVAVENYAQALRYCLPPNPPRNQDF